MIPIHHDLGPVRGLVGKNMARVTTVFLSLMIVGCTKEESPETQITKMLKQSVMSANEQDLGALMDNVSDEFIGPYTMGKQDAKRYIFAQLYRKQWHRVFLYDAKIDVQNETEAKAQIRIAIARGNKIEKLEDLKNKADYDAFQLKIDLIKNDSKWQVTKAQHQKLGSID